MGKAKVNKKNVVISLLVGCIVCSCKFWLTKSAAIVVEMDIKRKYLPKKILAMNIELTGVLPEPGERFLATKDGNQMVEERCIDTEKGEEPPAGPLYVEGRGIYWWNNVMRFKAMCMTVDNAEAELVSNLEKISL